MRHPSDDKPHIFGEYEFIDGDSLQYFPVKVTEVLYFDGLQKFKSCKVNLEMVTVPKENLYL